MNKKNYLFVMVFILVVILLSCEEPSRYATFQIRNYSQYELTDIFVSDSLPDQGVKDKLAPSPDPGKQYTECLLIHAWQDGRISLAQLKFCMNDLEYGSKDREDALADTTGRYKPSFQILDRDVIVVRIYDDRWEW